MDSRETSDGDEDRRWHTACITVPREPAVASRFKHAFREVM
jgi:hypothetical protein